MTVAALAAASGSAYAAALGDWRWSLAFALAALAFVGRSSSTAKPSGDADEHGNG
jgi:hypothetical protein